VVTFQFHKGDCLIGVELHLRLKWGKAENGLVIIRVSNLEFLTAAQIKAESMGHLQNVAISELKLA